VPWISVLGTHGNGQDIDFLVEKNTGPERTGHAAAGWGQVTFIQATGGPAN
jgi:hypothetical protein